MSNNWERREPTRVMPTPRLVTVPMQTLTPDAIAFFECVYELPPVVAEGWIRECPTVGRYAVQIRGPSRQERGWVLRQPWKYSPMAEHPLAQAGLKADTFKYLPAQPLLSHYGLAYDKGPLVVVEDQLSAIKLGAYGYGSVACLGKPDVEGSRYSGSDRVREIARRAGDREVLIALDADATDVAFRFVKKWRFAFRSIRVVMLTRDLKDTPASEFSSVLGA